MIKRSLLSLFFTLLPAAACNRQPSATGGPVTPVNVMGISLHGPASSLTKLPMLQKIGDGMFADHAKGLEFGVANDRVCYVLLRWHDPYLSFNDPAALVHGAFSGEFSVAGRQVSFTKDTREEQVVASFGEPYWRDVDEDEVLLFYEYPGLEMQVELTKDGPIRVLLATDDPLLANPKQRGVPGDKAMATERRLTGSLGYHRPLKGITLSALMDDVLSQLQEWYTRQCDGDWEHQYGVKVDTLDNPGWSVTIDLADTDLEGRPFEPIKHGLGDDASTDWHSISVKENF